MPVPATLAPLHLQTLNNLQRVAESFVGMQALLSDPLRGLASMQQYQLLLGETGRVLTTIASTFSSGGILFTKDEPGSAWSALLLSP